MEPCAVGRAIDEIRGEHRLSRKEFAWRVGYGVSYVRHIECGRRVLRVSMAVAWSHALGCTPPLLVRAAVEDQATAAGATLVVKVESEGQ